MIPTVLLESPRATLPMIPATWLSPEGRLLPERLLEAFLASWRQHGDPLLRSAPYHEIAPDLVLMAFLHRVVNGGGTLEREYAIGSGRMDLGLRHAGAAIAIELKVWRPGEPDPRDEGLAQLDRYLAGLPHVTAAWLVVFDRREHAPPSASRTSVSSALTPSGHEVNLVRA